MMPADERRAVAVEGHGAQGDRAGVAGTVLVKSEAQENDRACEVIGRLLADVPAGSSVWRALKFSALCLTRGSLLTDVERLFLLEDLKVAGLPAAQLRAVQAAMRADNDAVGRHLRDGAPSGVGTAVNEERPGGVAAGASGCDDAAALPAAQASLRDDAATLLAVQASLQDGAATLLAVQASLQDGAAALPVAQASHRDSCVALPAAQASHRNSAAALPAAQASLRDGAAALPAARASLVKWASPEDELDGIARYVQDAVRQGGEELPPSRVCVAVPDARWGRLVQRALEHRRFDVSRTQLGYALAEDPRDAGRARVTAAINALDLLACSEDPLAWRVRLGLGMLDLGAHAWGGLLEAWDGESVFDMAGLLASACAAQAASLLSACYEEARVFISEKHSLRGYSLAHAVGADEVPALEGLIGQLEGDEGAAVLAGKARRCLCGPVFDCSRPTVHVVTYDAVADRGYGLVVVLAAAEGLADGTDERGNPAILRAAGLPCDSLVISYFAGASVAAARKAHIPVGRTRLVDGIELAHVRPAAALASLGAALPPTQSGQAFLEA